MTCQPITKRPQKYQFEIPFKLAIGRFETFLGIGAKVECSAGSNDYKITDYTGPRQLSSTQPSTSKIQGFIKNQVGTKYRKIPKSQWRTRMRTGAQYNRAGRSQYVAAGNYGKQYLTFFFSMLGDLDLWIRNKRNWEHSSHQKTEVKHIIYITYIIYIIWGVYIIYLALYCYRCNVLPRRTSNMAIRCRKEM